MTNITTCDKCNKTKEKQEDWSTFTLDISWATKNMFNVETGYKRWDLCQDCSTIILPKILENLKDK